jgi:hypothetical protein
MFLLFKVTDAHRQAAHYAATLPRGERFELLSVLLFLVQLPFCFEICDEPL